MELNDLEIYRLAREISKEAWKIYNNLDWQTKKIMGDQKLTKLSVKLNNYISSTKSRKTKNNSF
jgi:hypothetical protein